MILRPYTLRRVSGFKTSKQLLVYGELPKDLESGTGGHATGKGGQDGVPRLEMYCNGGGVYPSEVISIRKVCSVVVALCCPHLITARSVPDKHTLNRT